MTAILIATIITALIILVLHIVSTKDFHHKLDEKKSIINKQAKELETYRDLQIAYNLLSDSYKCLKTDYDTLQEGFSKLNDQYTDLKEKHVSETIKNS